MEPLSVSWEEVLAQSQHSPGTISPQEVLIGRQIEREKERERERERHRKREKTEKKKRERRDREKQRDSKSNR